MSSKKMITVKKALMQLYKSLKPQNEKVEKNILIYYIER